MAKEPTLPIVKRDSDAGRAWLSYWRSLGQSTKFRERQKEFTVPSEYPPVGKSEAA